MVTHTNLHRQFLLEQEAISCGKQRLHDSLEKLEGKSYASASVYGVSSIREALPYLIKTVEDTFYRLSKGQAGKFYKEISLYLDELEPLAIATILLKVTFDRVFSTKRQANVLVPTMSAIGSALETECKFRWYKHNYPGLMHYISDKYFHDACGTMQKQVIASKKFGEHDIRWPAWGTKTKVSLGRWGLTAVMESTGWFTINKRKTHRKRYEYKVVPTPEFETKRDELIKTAELFSGIPWPMLVVPDDWGYDEEGSIIYGGYLTNRMMRGHDLTRKSNPYIKHGEAPINFLNKLQRVKYCVNRHVLEVAEEMRLRGRVIGKFIPIAPAYKPSRPADADDDAKSNLSWRRSMAEAYNADRINFKRSVRTRTQLEAAEKFKDESFYLCWSFDYRGRAYPIPAFLTPQDTDFGKAILNFADESSVTDEAELWLSFQVATTFGLDKSTLEDRHQWVSENTELITKVATDPIRYLSEWEEVDEPWQFMSSCHEYYHCCIAKDKLTTGLMVAVDATCSGLQILAALAKDKSTAELVNVVPSQKPSDAYRAVAEKAKEFLPDYMHPWMNRSVCKRTVMTIPYNATKDSSRKYIREALREQGLDPTKDELTQVVNAIYSSMDSIVPGPMNVMRWIKKHVGLYIRNGAKEVEWVTPSGFTVNQKRDDIETQIMELQLLGRTQVRIPTGKTTPSPIKHKSSTAPNYIHSFDASILHRSFNHFDEPFTVIHDSVLCRAGDMGTLNRLVRETYSNIFSEKCWLSEFAETINASEPPPIVGTLDPKVVSNSTYFFC
jgi:DNA-directed RNA polymerase